MRIGCKTGGPGDGVSYRGSHGQTVRVGRSVPYIGTNRTMNFQTFELEHDYERSKRKKWPFWSMLIHCVMSCKLAGFNNQ